MRRGLIAWSEEEMPAAVLQGVAAGAGRAAKAAGLDALLLFGDSGRPAALSRLTQFVPYWSAYFALVTTAGKVELVIGAGSQRSIPWIHESARVDEIFPARDFGATIAERVKAIAGHPAPKVGVVDLAVFPATPLDGLRAGCPDVLLSDATALFEGVAPTDAAALAGLGRRAAGIAHAALDAGLAASAGSMANAVVAAADRAARLAGAEEALIALVPDMAADPRLRRIEDDVALGGLFCLQLSVAYKGQWARVGRTLARGRAETPAWVAALDRWFDDVRHDPAFAADPGKAVTRALPASTSVIFWRLEGASATLPLTLLGASDRPPSGRPVQGAPSLSVRLRAPEGVWFAVDIAAQ
ncbi:MAG TPA: hypothetical protein VHD15_06965 [Hyphomicrobiales bacterium]|nr:hypothetical protein [Hyphomicrobiales bacterium]